jgi:beta-aspartyl-peptidase (threonine type)
VRRHRVRPRRLRFYDEPGDSRSHGTTGVVALDRKGNIAAGTSTGGLQGKMPGRVGDSPIIGAGTYASNQSCAVSATGTGEYFIRLGVAREICNLVRSRACRLQQAADQVIHHELEALHGDGGVIALTPGRADRVQLQHAGHVSRAAERRRQAEVGIYNDEPYNGQVQCQQYSSNADFDSSSIPMKHLLVSRCTSMLRKMPTKRNTG